MGRMKVKDIPAVIKEGKGRVFVCPFEGCEKQSCRKYNIQAHMRIHTEQTPYTCTHPNCGMTFKWRSSLVNHERYHRGETEMETADPVREDDSLKRLLSNSSVVTVDSADQNASGDEREQFYVAVILAEGFSSGNVPSELIQCPHKRCSMIFNSRDNFDMHAKEHYDMNSLQNIDLMQ